MGREASGRCHWKGESGAVKALLESSEIILRGEIRGRIARAAISAFAVEADTLVLTAGGEPLRLELGGTEAGKWAAVLARPVPTLAHKLGVGPASRAFVIGKVDDPELAAALAGATTSSLADAAVLIAVLNGEADLAAAFDVARTVPRCPLWCVYGKGRFVTVGDAAIRSFMRDHGYRDNKSCGVSDRLTATRYGKAR